ncbi:MAG TPA: hypothetical protein VJM33_09375, partial [Microthrixaceae bacterium]|nr:hypothetical protein [Microthrixaceae bacterium]
MSAEAPPADSGQGASMVDLAAMDAAVERLCSDDSVLRLSETEAEERSGYLAPTDEGTGERMLMNMGP